MSGKEIVRYRFGKNSLSVRYLEWDSGIFGFKIGRLENIKINEAGKVADRLINRIVNDCGRRHYRHVNCRVGLGDLTILHTFEKNGFNVADIQTTLSTGGKPKKKRTGSCGLTLARASENDIDRLKILVKDAFTDTRIVRDPNYPREKVDRFYYEWVKNSMFNKRQVVFLARENSSKELAGFVICDTLKGVGFIDLISVSRPKRGRGIGSALVNKAMNWFSENSKEAEVRTQMSNTAAVRMLMKCGFKYVTRGKVLPSGVSLHYWF